MGGTDAWSDWAVYGCGFFLFCVLFLEFLNVNYG